MPRFRSRPMHVEAHLWDGEPGHLPDGFAMALESFTPQREGQESVAIVPTLDGSVPARLGDVILRGPGGSFQVMPRAGFDLLFDRILEQDGPVAGNVTFVGDDEAPHELTWMGVRFVRGVPTPVSDPALIEAARNNGHFVVTEDAGGVTPDQPRRGPGRPRKVLSPNPSEAGADQPGLEDLPNG